MTRIIVSINRHTGEETTTYEETDKEVDFTPAIRVLYEDIMNRLKERKE